MVLPVYRQPPLFFPLILLELLRPIWSTRYRTYSAVASRSYTHFCGESSGGKGSIVFLIGDAAHAHPITEDRGINLGVLDAVIPGLVLAAHSQKKYSVAVHSVEEHTKKRRARKS